MYRPAAQPMCDGYCNPTILKRLLGMLKDLRASHLAFTFVLISTLHAGDIPAEAAKPVIGQMAGLTLLADDFDGTGPITANKPAEDINGHGWLTTMANLQPRCDGGRLVSGGEGGVAAIMLPPLSRHGEITISATLLLRGGGSLTMGFSTAASNLRDGDVGPLLRIGGNGQWEVFRDASTAVKAGRILRPTDPGRPVGLTILYRLWDRTMVVSANGRVLANATFAKTPPDPYRCLNIIFDAADAKSGPAIDALRIDYVPVPRPQPMVANQTVVVRDTTVAGITKAIQDANARSGPDNIIEVSIPKGDYHIKIPDGFTGGQIFLVLGLKNLIIDWNDSTIVIDDPWFGLFSLSHGNRVTVRNIASIDYPQDNLPFTQGTVRAFNEADRTFDLEIDAGYPLPDNAFFKRKSMNWGQVIDPAKPGTQAAGSALHYDIKSVTNLGGRLFRYAIQQQLYAIRTGSRFAHCPRTGNEVFRIFEAEDIRLENITGHSGPNFWSMIYHARVSYDNVRVLLKPGRMMSVNGDIASGEQNRLWIEDCVFEGNADDICHQFRGEALFVANSIFRRSRRFGVWFNTSEHGVVKGCLFDGVGKFAITGMKEPGMREDIRFASRNIICVENTIRNCDDDDGITLGSTHTQQDASSHWNTYWRLIGNSSSVPISIKNATDVACVGNYEPSGRPTAIEVDQARCREIVARAGKTKARPPVPKETPTPQPKPKSADATKPPTAEPVKSVLSIRPEGMASFDAKLLSRVRELIDIGKPPMFSFSSMHSKAIIEQADSDGNLLLLIDKSELTWHWRRLDIIDKADLAVSMARAFNPGDAAESAFWLFASGQREAGERQLTLSDPAGRSTVRSAIIIASAPAQP